MLFTRNELKKFHQSAAEANFWEEYPLWKGTTTHRQQLATTEAMCGTRRIRIRWLQTEAASVQHESGKNSPSYYQPKGSIELLSKIYYKSFYYVRTVGGKKLGHLSIKL